MSDPAPDLVARGLTPPYYAVIFTALPSAQREGYAQMAARMLEGAARMDGFLGVESARGESGPGITVSYWRDEAAIAAWKADTHHRAAQTLGIERWYAHYELRVARVERAYAGPEGRR